MQTHTIEVLSLNSARVTIKPPLVRKATENHLMKPTSLVKLTPLSLVSAKLEIEYATRFLYDKIDQTLALHGPHMALWLTVTGS